MGDLPYPGSKGSECVSLVIQIQDAHTCIPSASGASRHLVHFWCPKRWAFPYSGISTAQELSENSFQCTCYEYIVLPSGLSLSLRVFVQCTEAVKAPLRKWGIQLATSLKDWLILTLSEWEDVKHTQILLQHLFDMGFVIKHEKSMISLVQNSVFLGLVLDSVSFNACLSADRVDTLRSWLFRLHRSAFIIFFQAVPLANGNDDFRHPSDPNWLSAYKGFSVQVAMLRLHPTHYIAWRMTVKAECILALHPWCHHTFLVQGVPLDHGKWSQQKPVGLGRNS